MTQERIEEKHKWKYEHREHGETTIATSVRGKTYVKKTILKMCTYPHRKLKSSVHVLISQ